MGRSVARLRTQVGALPFISSAIIAELEFPDGRIRPEMARLKEVKRREGLPPFPRTFPRKGQDVVEVDLRLRAEGSGDASGVGTHEEAMIESLQRADPGVCRARESAKGQQERNTRVQAIEGEPRAHSGPGANRSPHFSQRNRKGDREGAAIRTARPPQKAHGIAETRDQSAATLSRGMP